jgi:hypothetical protein
MPKNKILKRKSSKSKKMRKINIRRRKITQKFRGGLQKVYITVQPSALGVRGEREWSDNVIVNADKPYVPKLSSKVFIDNDSGIDIDERIAEIVGSVKDSVKMMTPYHRKMMTSEILSKTTK